jgi:membrane-associated protease RseP (regulator of RpoE activity)
MNVFAAMAVLALLIVIHEVGHFLAATLQGIRVSGFSIGFGPALIKRQRRGVTYAIRALPLGGFVAFPDDDEDSTIPADDPDLLRNRPIPQRALVIAAGVLANLLLALVVLFGQAALVGLPAEPDPGVLVVAVQPGGAADRAGLTPGDRVLSLEGDPLSAGQEAVRAMVQTIKSSPDQTLRLQRQRDQRLEVINMTPLNQQGQGRIGAQLQTIDSGDVKRVSIGFGPKPYSNRNPNLTGGESFAVQEYFDTMPWYAFPFGDTRIESLKSKYEVSGIPWLVILDAQGNLIANEADNDVPQGTPAYQSWLAKANKHSVAGAPAA